MAPTLLSSRNSLLRVDWLWLTGVIHSYQSYIRIHWLNQVVYQCHASLDNSICTSLGKWVLKAAAPRAAGSTIHFSVPSTADVAPLSLSLCLALFSFIQNQAGCGATSHFQSNFGGSTYVSEESMASLRAEPRALALIGPISSHPLPRWWPSTPRMRASSTVEEIEVRSVYIWMHVE